MADVNDKGEVTVEGQFVGKLEGFRFRQDSSTSPDEAKTLRQASLQALKPEFHLRADRFYNAPDTEIDFTDQGGLMWGELALGKLVAGPDALKPQVEAFIDEEAGHDVVQKVQRRLQHFIDRKVATLFEPLLNMQRDETLTGLARGFAFGMVEMMGIAPRDFVASDVKNLDQEARGFLRKHGIRFGQFTVFMPLLLKPAPTRLRLVLWSLGEKLDEFPDSPPPGLVTIPTIKGSPEAFHTMSGYRAAGERAIRIDMLERLADLLRAENSRAGFEAKPDMLSITGMTLEQFADLMQGLGYVAARAEREKVKAAPAETPEATALVEAETRELPVATEEVVASETPLVEAAEPEDADQAADDAPVSEVAKDDAPEMETYFTFTWGGFARKPDTQRPKNKPRGKPKSKRGPNKGAPQAKQFQARPSKKEKSIDPDNPFAAALMGLKDKS